MILSSGVSKGFWGEAMVTAAILINKSPAVSLNFKTPDQVWTGTTGDYSKLKVFGCLALAHIKQDKLEARALRCIFIGYPKGVKGYKLWCIEPGQGKCIISRDVQFNEEILPLKNKQAGVEATPDRNLHNYAPNSNTSDTRIELDEDRDHSEVEPTVEDDVADAEPILPVNEESSSSSESDGDDQPEEVGETSNYQLT